MLYKYRYVSWILWSFLHFPYYVSSVCWISDFNEKNNTFFWKPRRLSNNTNNTFCCNLRDLKSICLRFIFPRTPSYHCGKFRRPRVPGNGIRRWPHPGHRAVQGQCPGRVVLQRQALSGGLTDHHWDLWHSEETHHHWHQAVRLGEIHMWRRQRQDDDYCQSARWMHLNIYCQHESGTPFVLFDNILWLLSKIMYKVRYIWPWE